MAGKVYFIGAGPGDPELLTLKAKRIIDQADVILYADSLVNPLVYKDSREDVEIYKSASLSLEQTTEIIVKAVAQGKTVARLQSGDPSIYGAIREQVEALKESDVEVDVVPGVSSVFAAAAALKAELTVPEVSQTVIITRREGRTPVPPKERLTSLAGHQSTLALFLSVGMADKVVEELIEGGYPKDTPVAVVYRASWEDEKVIRGKLEELAPLVTAAGIKKQALILVGKALNTEEMGTKSKLYDEAFSHEYRTGRENEIGPLP